MGNTVKLQLGHIWLRHGCEYKRALEILYDFRTESAAAAPLLLIVIFNIKYVS